MTELWESRPPLRAVNRPVMHLGSQVKCLTGFLLGSLLAFSGCSGSNSGSSQNYGQVSGNWQFTMTAPSDGSSLGGIQGGFLLQEKASIRGAVVYAIQLSPSQPGGLPTLCNGGSGPVAGKINGSNVTLTVVASPQTFALTGTLSADGTTMMGTYNSTDGQGCGTAQNGLAWSATLVPSLSGSVQGNLHSVLDPTLKDQDFPFTGFLIQGANIGASNATVTGSLNFQGYPCLSNASVNGQISGNSVILYVIAPDGSEAGQIGAPAGDTNPSPVAIVNSATGIVVQGTNGYGISSKSCPGGNVPGDVGNICMALGNSTSCAQPITLSPASLTYVPQLLGSAPTSQTITLTNSGSVPLSGMTLAFSPQSGATDLFGLSDFNGLPNFGEQDNCANPLGSAFNLAPQQSCTITISFSPQQSCPWLPSVALGGEPPTLCPFALDGSLTVNSPVSADNDTAFSVPVTGVGLSAITPSTGELDFGAEALGETSASQALSFTNQGGSPVQILPALNSPCVNPPVGVFTLQRPLVPGSIAGLQVDSVIQPNPPTINYNCDSDRTSNLPNFQISSDNCSGTLLAPQGSCSVQIAFSPQPSTPLIPALDYFLELNTLQCTTTTISNCEIDSGRFPVELKANVPSPLRMTPGAGLDFGQQSVGQTSNPMAITIYNDPKDPNAGTITFTGNILQGNFSETDGCTGSLAPGGSCTIAVTFTPKAAGFTSGTITIGFGVGQIQTIYLRGTGQ
jgi:hypothetical protein